VTRLAAVTFDLDDTLYPQSAHLGGAWRALAVAAGSAGVPDDDARRLHDALLLVAAEGSDKGRIVDRALAHVGLPAGLAPSLVRAFRAYAPAHLDPYPGARDALDRLRRLLPIGCITDGDPAIQRAKLAALGLADAFDVVVLSDELGREHRKPDPLPFRTALTALEVDPGAAVHVGDRYTKDVAGATAVGMRAVRVRTGEYAETPDPPDAVRPWFDCADVVAAVDRLVEVAARDEAGGAHRASVGTGSSRCSTATSGEWAST
jgi:putative hydrolase of the HAD superfamily